MRQLRGWTFWLRRVGLAYAAIVLSIVGINIPSGDVVAAKKVAEAPSPSTADDVAQRR